MAPKRRKSDTSGRQEIVYVRVAEDVKLELSKFLQSNTDYSERLIIERLISYFNDLPDEEKKELLKEDRKLISISKLVGLLGWADHAFQGKRWEWALRSFQSLDSFQPMSAELRSLVKYKQGYCSLDIAIALRAEALLALVPIFSDPKSKSRRSTPPGDAFDVCKRTLDDADTALRMSIVYHEEFPGEHPVVEFNTACGWVLRCQYLIERTLVEAVQTRWNQGGKNQELTKRLQDLISEVASDAQPKPVAEQVREIVREAMVETDDSSKRTDSDLARWWEKFGPNWRNELGGVDEYLLTKIRRYADKAFKALDELIRGREDSDRISAVPLTDAEYLIRLAKEDADFVFLRCDTAKDGGLRSRFDEWASHAKGKEWMHETFRSIYRHMPQEKREKVNNLDMS